MMLKALFSAARDITSEDARAYMRAHRPEEFTLLDVRQPGEYERAHIPGARLIPLPQLSDRLDELERDKPVIAYCAVGGRSRAAAEMLKGRGFEEVYSLKGGIKAWDGLTAAGPVEQGLGLVSGREDREHLLIIALGLEQGLAAFYRQAGPLAREPLASELCGRLAQVEDKHQERVYALYREGGGDLERPVLEERVSALVMEGGEEVGPALARLFPQGYGRLELLETAMGIEAQALDLYLRMTEKVREGQARQALYDLAQDEKAHLAMLGGLLEGAPA